MNKVHFVQPPGKSRGKVVKLRIRIARVMCAAFLVLSICLATGGAFAQQFDRDKGSEATLASLDPGPRVGFAVSGNPGNPIAGLTADQTTFFQNGLSQFTQVETVAVTSPGNGGLGPAFNNDSCGGCHSQPATGGTSARGAR